MPAPPALSSIAIVSAMTIVTFSEYGLATYVVPHSGSIASKPSGSFAMTRIDGLLSSPSQISTGDVTAYPDILLASLRQARSARGSKLPEVTSRAPRSDDSACKRSADFALALFPCINPEEIASCPESCYTTLGSASKLDMTLFVDGFKVCAVDTDPLYSAMGKMVVWSPFTWRYMVRRGVESCGYSPGILIPDIFNYEYDPGTCEHLLDLLGDISDYCTAEGCAPTSPSGARCAAETQAFIELDMSTVAAGVQSCSSVAVQEDLRDWFEALMPPTTITQLFGSSWLESGMNGVGWIARVSARRFADVCGLGHLARFSPGACEHAATELFMLDQYCPSLCDQCNADPEASALPVIISPHRQRCCRRSANICGQQTAPKCATALKGMGLLDFDLALEELKLCRDSTSPLLRGYSTPTITNDGLKMWLVELARSCGYRPHEVFDGALLSELPTPKTTCGDAEDDRICSQYHFHNCTTANVFGTAIRQICPAMCNSCNVESETATAANPPAGQSQDGLTPRGVGILRDESQPSCPHAKKQWVFEGKCFYTMRCKGGLVERLAFGERVKCNCITRVNGVNDKSCHSCVIYGGTIESAVNANLSTGPNPMVLQSGITRKRYARFKASGLDGVSSGWFKCSACRTPRLLHEGKCISQEACLTKAEGLIVYMPKPVSGGRCTRPFECVRDLNSATGAGCKCPKAMVGCIQCRYTGTWRDGGGKHLMSGPVCTGCREGRYLALLRNYDAAQESERKALAASRGVGLCLRRGTCLKRGGNPDPSTMRCALAAEVEPT